MARMPGAVWRPVPVSPSRPKRRKGRGICLHVAVSEAASLHGYFSTASADSHFYVAKNGVIEQYVDTDLIAYTNGAGNASLISVETQGGVTNTEGEKWTPEQVASLTKIVKWAASSDGFPLQVMPNSRPESRGVGWHKLGCKPWVVSGGEVWSSAYGKVCPGLAKIAQIPAIVAAAKGGSVAGEPTPKPTPKPTPEDDMPTAADIWNYDAGGADGTQRAKDLLSQVNTGLTKPVARVDADAFGPGEGDVEPVSRLKMIDYLDARTRRLERDVAEILTLLRGQQPPAA